MAEYYLDPNGIGGTPDDGNAGTIGSPWATIDGACQQMSGGDTLYFRTSTITCTSDTRLTNPFRNAPNGTGVGSETIFTPYLNETVTLLNGSDSFDSIIYLAYGMQHIIWDGFILDGNYGSYPIRSGVDSPNLGYLTFRNLEIFDSRRTGVNLHASDGGVGPVVVQNCYIHDCGTHPTVGTQNAYGIYLGHLNGAKILYNRIRHTSGAGIHLYGANFNATDQIVKGNRISDFGYFQDTIDGVLCATNGLGTEIVNNVIFAPGGATAKGVRLFRGNQVSILHNTVHGMTTIGIALESGTGHFVANNLVINTSGTAIAQSGGSGTLQDNRTSGVAADLWVSPWDGSTLTEAHLNSRDYQLKVGSAAIDPTGISPVGVNDDINLVTRPQGSLVDQGAHEFSEAGSGFWSAANQNPGGVWADSSFIGYTVRLLMKATAWDTSTVGGSRLIFIGRTDAPYTIEKVSVVERDGATLNGVDVTNQQVTFGGTWAAGGTVPPNSELASDVISALDQTKDYFVTFYGSGTVGAWFNAGTTDSAWFIAGDDATDIDWGAKTPAFTRSHIYSVTRIEEDTSSPESAPGIDVALTQLVTPGVLRNLGADADDQDGNIVTGYVLCAAGNAGFDFDPSGCTITHKTS